MSGARRTLCALYLSIAALALVATWRQNLAFGSEHGISGVQLFVQFWPALFANRATISITVDIFLVALTASIWMVIEARRLRVKLPWLYVLGGIFIAISVTFPLFLFARELRLAAHDPGPTEPTPTPGDKLGLGFLTLGTAAFAVWCTLR